AERTQADRQVLQGLAVVAAQAVEVGGETGQVVLITLQARLGEVDVLVGDAARLRERQRAIDQVLRDRRPEQAGEVGFQPVAQPPQRIRAFVVDPYVEIGERAV